MIIQFKTFSSDHLFTCSVTPQEWAEALNTGMLGSMRLKSMLIHPYEVEEGEECVLYSFENAKAGIPPFVTQLVEE